MSDNDRPVYGPPKRTYFYPEEIKMMSDNKKDREIEEMVLHLKQDAKLASVNRDRLRLAARKGAAQALLGCPRSRNHSMRQMQHQNRSQKLQKTQGKLAKKRRSGGANDVFRVCV